MALNNILHNLPEVTSPVEKKLSFNLKLRWTLIVLVSFFVLANIPLFGLGANALAKFELYATILAADFGSIISLGIGPIVMASIILQLLTGSKILNIDTTTKEGKRFFQGIQKLMVFFFIIFEACVYVLMKGLAPAPGLGSFFGPFILIFQLCLGGLAIVFMDELSTKWGFGPGVSLFIAAGVSWRLFTGLFQFLGTEGTLQATGKIWMLISSIIAGDTTGATLAFAVLAVTVLIFLIVVWAQSLKVEVPLSFDRLRGYNIKWPLSFFYTSVIPVILTAALAANIQLVGGILSNAATPCLMEGIAAPECVGLARFAYRFKFLGVFSKGRPISGFSYWISNINLVNAAITGSFKSIFLLQALGHILFYVFFAILFAFFWMKTSGMDAQSQAKNIMASGLQIPGFRKDERVLESVLNRYIPALTIMGGAAIGILASVTNLLGALISGTAILLVIMIMYQFYQNIAQQHAIDMHPALRKMMG